MNKVRFYQDSSIRNKQKPPAHDEELVSFVIDTPREQFRFVEKVGGTS